MGIKLTNTSFKLSNGSSKFFNSLAFGEIYRFSAIDLPGFIGSIDVPYVNPYNISSSLLIGPGGVAYVYVKSGSLIDQIAGGPVYLTDMFFREVFDDTSPFLTTNFTEELITTTGAGTWTKPLGVTQVIIECWGAGGAGGGAASNNTGGGGGGGGQYSRKYIQYSSPSIGISYSVGAGGVGSTGNGTAGGDTTWDTNVVVAKGGGGGANNNGAGGVAPTTNGVGDITYIGTDGEPGAFSSPAVIGGTGGSGAGSTGNATISSPTTPEYGGAGGFSVSGTSGGLDGNPGSIYGGGGGGGFRASGASRSGGAGAQGLIRILYR